MAARGWATPCILSPSGNPSNHHRAHDPVWGEVIGDRVTPARATHLVVVAPYRGGFLSDVVEVPR